MLPLSCSAEYSLGIRNLLVSWAPELYSPSQRGEAITGHDTGAVVRSSSLAQLHPLLLNVCARDLGMDVNMASFVGKMDSEAKGQQQDDPDVGADQLAGMQGGEPSRSRGSRRKVIWATSYNQAQSFKIIYHLII